ncbi:hypothetical protein KAR91_65980 [Candidatus Pacearchaeota archaeon]|nr:hypothetical protein [Candidatus Pacearchaeota archaeon]
MSEELEQQYGIFDFQDEDSRGTGLLPEVLKNSENIKKVINIFMQMIQELHDSGKDVYSEINILESVGSQLDDIFGNILDLDREPGQSDDEYRALLLAAAPKLSQGGEIIVVKNMFRSLTGASKVTLVEYQPAMFMMIAEVDDISSVNVAFLHEQLRQIRAAGVRMELALAQAGNAFTLKSIGDPDEQLLGFADLDNPDPLVGGLLATLIPKTNQDGELLTEAGDNLTTEDDDLLIFNFGF